ncbi:MAG TPA: apolipoprotein N-acyltransferase [Candidatus Binataceae bacterium]|nr:apolipoprotein N-acyltransferase [Candidatus Binataceae bacterium]
MSSRSDTLTRVALSAASGVALALAFPKFDLDLLAWVAFIPLLYAIDQQSLKATFVYGWIQGLACYVVLLYWITITLHTFGSLPLVIAVLPMLLLSAILAIYTGAAFWASAFCTTRTRIPMVIALPIIWTGIEWLRSFFPIGFPWGYVGYAEYRNLELIQFAELTGVYGISALVVFFNAVLYAVLFGRHSRSVQRAALGTLTAMMIAAVLFGAWRIHHFENLPATGKLRIALAQGDIPQSVKWNPGFLATSFGVYVAQSETGARQGAQLIVWPEAAAAFLFQPDDHYPAALAADANYRARLLDLARTIGTPILFGAPAAGIENGELGFYNRAYLVSGQGRIEGFYDKMQLVPFGEYIPLRSLLGPFVHRVVKGFGDMIPGRVQTIFDVDGARLGVLICYESVFPDLTRKAVKRGAEILINITNDAWYGESSAPYQLLSMAAMRSVETKTPMVRVANTGISAVILPTGRITAGTPLSIRTTETEEVAYRPERTIYTMVGDLFAEICFLLGIAGLFWALFWPVPAISRKVSVGPDPGAGNGRG